MGSEPGASYPRDLPRKRTWASFGHPVSPSMPRLSWHKWVCWPSAEVTSSIPSWRCSVLKRGDLHGRQAPHLRLTSASASLNTMNHRGMNNPGVTHHPGAHRSSGSRRVALPFVAAADYYPKSAPGRQAPSSPLPPRPLEDTDFPGVDGPSGSWQTIQRRLSFRRFCLSEGDRSPRSRQTIQGSTDHPGVDLWESTHHPRVGKRSEPAPPLCLHHLCLSEHHRSSKSRQAIRQRQQCARQASIFISSVTLPPRPGGSSRRRQSIWVGRTCKLCTPPLSFVAAASVVCHRYLCRLSPLPLSTPPLPFVAAASIVCRRCLCRLCRRLPEPDRQTTSS